jgi:hypothetical protein
VKKFHDDWGTALGEDRSDTPAPTKSPKKLTATTLVYFFQSQLPAIYQLRLNAPVNAKALAKAIKTCTEKGLTLEQVKEMMMLFIDDITKRPLPEDIQPWRGFIANMDSLAKRLVTVKDKDEYHGWTVDGRLSDRA